MRFSYEIEDVIHTVDIDRTEEGYRALVDGEPYTVTITKSERGELSFCVGGKRFDAFVAADGCRRWVHLGGESYAFDCPPERPRTPGRGGREGPGERTVRAPMPGQIRAVQVQPGDAIEKGQTLLLVEAMKMEIRIQAPHAGRVLHVLVRPGQTVEREQALAELES